MRKVLGLIPLLAVISLAACGGNNNSSDKYKISEARYNEICNYDNYVRNIVSFNMTVTFTERNGDDTYTYLTKYDNGKISTRTDDHEFFIEFKKGTYNAENRTWTYDYYYEEDGVWKKDTYTDGLPDDIAMPDPQFLVDYSGIVFNKETNRYNTVETSFIKNLYYVYTNVEIGFENKNIVYYGYQTYQTSKPDEISYVEYVATNFGSTTVTLPVVE